MADKKEVKEEKMEAPKELKPKADCPICKGEGFVVVVPGSNIKVGCTCKFK